MSVYHHVSRRQFLAKSTALMAGTLALPLSALAGAARTTGHAAVDANPDLSLLVPLAAGFMDGHIALRSRAAPPITTAIPKLWARVAGATGWVGTEPLRLRRIGRSAAALTLKAEFDGISVDMVLRQFRGNRVWKISGVLTNTSPHTLELARFHYLDGQLAGSGFLELNGGREQPVLRTGRAQVAQRPDLESMWQGMGAAWPRFADPIVDEAGWYGSIDYAAFTRAWDQPGWGFGFVAPGNAFGEIGYRAAGNAAQVYVGVNLDGVSLASGQQWVLEDALVWCGDLQEGLQVWAQSCAHELKALRRAPPLVGYCSWYQLGGAVRGEDFDRAIQEFAAWPAPPGGRVVQLDAGWESTQGNWRANAKFPDWQGLPARIAATGSIPGLWIAPLMVNERDAIMTDHPDWLQRMGDGTPAVSFPGAATGAKGSKIHFLDPDHPEVQTFIRETFRRLHAEGWQYFKIDFTYPVTGARHSPGRVKTSFQSQRELYELIRAAVGPQVLLNACIGAAGRYVIGSVDVARIGGDASFNFASVKLSLQQSLSRCWTNGAWFQADCDVFSMRTAASKLIDEERRVLTGTLGLSGGLFLTSDLPSQWSAEDVRYVQRFWNALGPAVPVDQRVVWSPAGEIMAYRASVPEGNGMRHRVALYNWADRPRDSMVSLAALNVRANIRLDAQSSDSGARLVGRELRIAGQPPHSLRIVELTEI